MSFDRALPLILAAEGGYANDPADHGGATNQGITQSTYDQWQASQGKPVQDVRDIPDSDVEAIYSRRYWYAAQCDQLPWPLSYVHMDCAVNSGVRRAILTLQFVVGTPVDGLMGPNTLNAVADGDPIKLSERYCNEREAFYQRLAAKDLSQEKFLAGWLKRVAKVRQVVEESQP